MAISLLPTALLGSDALAATGSAATWSTIEITSPKTNPDNTPPGYPGGPSLSAIDCPSASSCVAVGYYVDTMNGYWGVIATFTKGAWTELAAPEPASNPAGQPPGSDTSRDSFAMLHSVSCTSATSYVAVGQYEDADHETWGLIETLANGTWSATAAPEPATSPAGAAPLAVNQANLAGVSCTSATSCVAVGDYVDAAKSFWGLIETLTNGTWSATAALEPSSNLNGLGPEGDLGELDEVSCSGPSTCVAGGLYADSSNTDWGLLETLSGGVWSPTAAPEPATNPAGRGPGVGADGDTISGVSCVPSGFCVAVGSYLDSGRYFWGLIETLSGGTWVAEAAPEPAENADGVAPGENAELRAISCVSDTFCAAGGEYADADGRDWGLLEVFSNGAWTTSAATEPPTTVDGTAPGTDADQHEFGSINGVSCPFASFCLATGTYADDAQHAWPFAELLSGAGTWSTTAAPEPSNSAGEATGENQNAGLSEVSCATDGSCGVFGGYFDNLNAEQPLVDNYLPAPPAVSALSRSSGRAGTQVVVRGSGFTPASTVNFGSRPATTTYVSPELLDATAPSGSGKIDVQVTNAGATSEAVGADRFRYTAPAHLRVARSTESVVGGKAAVALACSGAPCKGTVRLEVRTVKTLVVVTHHGKKTTRRTKRIARTLVIGQQRYALAKGRVAVLFVALTKVGRELLVAAGNRGLVVEVAKLSGGKATVFGTLRLL